jgi:hypothetical protein
LGVTERFSASYVATCGRATASEPVAVLAEKELRDQPDRIEREGAVVVDDARAEGAVLDEKSVVSNLVNG